MNKNSENYDAELWSNFFDFVYPDERNMTRAEVQKELQRLNIDIRSAMSKLNLALATFHNKQKAQAELKNAKDKRLSLLEKLRQIKLPDLPTMRNEIQEVISQYFSAPQQATYFRKLEEAASEQDLRALLEDIILLELLDKDSDDEK